MEIWLHIKLQIEGLNIGLCVMFKQHKKVGSTYECGFRVSESRAIMYPWSTFLVLNRVAWRQRRSLTWQMFTVLDRFGGAGGGGRWRHREVPMGFSAEAPIGAGARARDRFLVAPDYIGCITKSHNTIEPIRNVTFLILPSASIVSATCYFNRLQICVRGIF